MLTNPELFDFFCPKFITTGTVYWRGKMSCPLPSQLPNA